MRIFLTAYYNVPVLTHGCRSMLLEINQWKQLHPFSFRTQHQFISVLLTTKFECRVTQGDGKDTLTTANQFFTTLMAYIFAHNLAQPCFFPFKSSPRLFCTFTKGLVKPGQRQILTACFYHLPGILITRTCIQGLPEIVERSSLLL